MYAKQQPKEVFTTNPITVVNRILVSMTAAFVLFAPSVAAQDTDTTAPADQYHPYAGAESVVITAKRCNQLGMTAQSRGDLENAAKQYRQAIELCPGIAAYHNNLAMALKDMGQLEQAKQEELKAIALKGFKGSYHYNLGIILQRMQDLEGAEHEFRTATEKDALDGDFRYHLAQALLLLRRAPQAEEEARILVAANNQDASFHKLLADTLYAQGKSEDALYEYRRSLEIKPVTAETREIENRIASIRESLGLH